MYYPACDANYTFPYWGREIQYPTYLLYLIFLPAQPAFKFWEFRQTELALIPWYRKGTIIWFRTRSFSKTMFVGF